MTICKKQHARSAISIPKEALLSGAANLKGEYVIQGLPIVSGSPVYTNVRAVIDNRIDIEQFSSKVSVHVEDELARFHEALQHSLNSLQLLSLKLQNGNNQVESSVISAQIAFLSDPVFCSAIENGIIQRKQRVEQSVAYAMFHLRHAFSQSSNNEFCDRYDDVEDVCCRILSFLNRETRKKETELLKKLMRETKKPGAGTIIAYSLAPSIASELTAQGIQAVVTCQGGAMSHTAIVCRAKGIPYISGVPDAIFSSVVPGDSILIQPEEGVIAIRPTLQRMNSCLALRQIRSSQDIAQDCGVMRTTREQYTQDGSSSIQLMATVDSVDEVQQAIEQGMDGIGLYRTEYFAFQLGAIPSFEEQKLKYTALVREARGKPVVFRTFDFSSDKSDGQLEERIPGLQEEQRTVPLVFSQPEILQEQLYAIFEAAQNGEARVLFPMVSSREELQRYCSIFESVWQKFTECRSSKNISLKRPQVGAMIELPLAALSMSSLKGSIDYMSVGTNDLLQYALALNRSSMSAFQRHSEKPLASHIGFLHILKYIIDQAKLHEIPLCICGELACDPAFLPLLIGFGVTSLSFPPRNAQAVLKVISSLGKDRTLRLAEAVLSSSSSEEVTDLISRF